MTPEDPGTPTPSLSLVSSSMDMRRDSEEASLSYIPCSLHSSSSTTTTVGRDVLLPSAAHILHSLVVLGIHKKKGNPTTACSTSYKETRLDSRLSSLGTAATVEGVAPHN